MPVESGVIGSLVFWTDTTDSGSGGMSHKEELKPGTD